MSSREVPDDPGIPGGPGGPAGPGGPTRPLNSESARHKERDVIKTTAILMNFPDNIDNAN